MIYFDNAATTFPKPLSVYRELERCTKNYCGNPGRGSHSLSRISAEKIYEARELISAHFGSNMPENVIFTYNDTYALNMMIKGVLQKGDHVIISDMEHNSVYRPIEALYQKGIITYDIFDSMCLFGERSAEKICANIRKLIKRETKLLIANHISNICSAELPIEDIGRLCKAHGIIFMVDAAQSAGHMPINMEKMNIDILCAPGHKALFGIQGSGFAILQKDIIPCPIIEGGSGVDSLMKEMPELPPERFEAGTLSVPSIVSLAEGVRFVEERGIKEIHDYELALFDRAVEILKEFPKINIYAEMHRGATLMFNIENIDCQRVSDLLDGTGICTRSGLHCSPLAHKALGTVDSGAVRISFSPFNTLRELDFFYAALKSII